MVAPARTWLCGSRRITFDRPYVMGILNVTPDSFSNQGEHFDTASAIAHAERMINAGADIIDIGAESSRPGATSLPCEEEWRRLAPVLDAVVAMGVPVSVDTYKAEIMLRAADGGATIINDIYGLTQPGAAEAAARTAAGLCVMHMQGSPRNMQQAPHYGNVVVEVRDWLLERAATLESMGVVRERLCIDPGFGFGKTLDHNARLLRSLGVFIETSYPVLIGVSRKSMIAGLTARTDSKPQERVAGSVAAALWAVAQGAHLVRVHDVAQTVDALRVWRGCSSE